MMPFLLGAALAPPPATIAELTVTWDAAPLTLVLTETQRWENKALAPVSELQDPLSTHLTPKLKRQAGTNTLQLTGYRLSQHEQPGDTRVTTVLLLEIQGEQVTGYWWEDHQEVPTMLWQIEGTWERNTGPGGSLNLVLFPVDGVGPGGAAKGLIREE